MSANIDPWTWTVPRERAAALVADDHLTDAQIAGQAEITERQLARWKLVPAFRVRVQEHVAAMRAAIAAEGIANKQNRVDRLNCRAGLIDKVIEARAADPSTLGAPGGDTGLLVRQVKLVKVYEAKEGSDTLFSAKRDVEVEEFALDTGLLAELRAIEKQAAQELGEWVEKGEVSGPHGGPIKTEAKHVGSFDFAGFAEAFAALAGGDAAGGPPPDGDDPSEPVGPPRADA